MSTPYAPPMHNSTFSQSTFSISVHSPHTPHTLTHPGIHPHKLASTHYFQPPPLPHRLRKQAVWERAVDWIARHESRVRVEEGRIAGEDFTVWRWIQSDPPPTEEPRKNERDSFWQGKVFEEYPPGMDSRIAPPAGQPSPCIRLKNMFDSARFGMGGVWHGGRGFGRVVTGGCASLP